jgi:N-sulfoglucosamine sulfohydrolase
MNPLLVIIAALQFSLAGLHAAPPLNILFFTADDMNYDSTGVCGGPIKNLTPHIDRLAAEGLRFEHAYSTVAVCQPVRQTMQTGLYPHRSGSMGFFPIKPEVRTLNQQLHDAGYLISMFGKGKHHQPAEKFCVDVADDTISRRPSKLAEATRKVLRMAREQNRPFFHNVNCYDPHRPFIGIKGADDLAEGEPPSRWIKPEEITEVPGFLEDLPDVRRELAGYYTNVRRLDDAVGAVLSVLKEEGFAENTLVMFYGGDHGMSFPFGKSNSYENSSRGALVIRWPGVTTPGLVDRDHLVSTLDFTPTLLEAARLPAIPGIDGRSFVPAVKGNKMAGWDRVFTFYNAAFGSNWLPMRCVRTKDRSYIWNAWSDGDRKYHTENMAGLSWKSMLAAAASSPEIKARTEFYLHRVPEEFYDMSSDPSERVNLIAAPARQAEIETMRKELISLMQRTGDPFAEAFTHRDDKELVPTLIKKLKEKYSGRAEAE